jgi:Ca-activated chloride channel family protein
VRRVADPGLLEYAGKDLFEADVFPIEPRSTKKIELAYTQVIKAENGAVSYRYPLGSGRRLLTQPVGQISASIEVSSPVDLKNIFSPSHKIVVIRDGEKRARLSFEGTGQDAQKDFQVYYSLSEKDFGLSLLAYREPGKDGYFLLLLAPKTRFDEHERMAKDVVFVLDTSGSMSGEKIDKAKAALRFGVESLDPRDRFNLISFSGEEHLMSGALSEATKEARHKAMAFIDSLRAEGGTNINDALVTALQQFHSTDRPSMIVFLTDGLPTVGTTDTKQIIKNVEEANRAHVRLFSFGVGYDVNTNLLDKLSSDNRGGSDYIEPQEDLEIKVSNFFAKINYPVLSDLRLDLGGVETERVYPRVLPDIFKGSQLVVVGRYRNSAENATIRLTGKIGSRSQTFTFAGNSFPAEGRHNEFLPRLWATRRVGYLLEQIRLNGENKELIDEIVSLGTRFGIVTQYTSFLVTDDVRDAVRRGDGPRVSGVQSQLRDYDSPVPLASRDNRTATYNGSGSGAGTGPKAVARSRIERKMAESEAAPSPEQYLSTIRTVGTKTFRLKGDVWVDTEYDEDAGLKTVRIKFGSDEFFNLIEKQPKLAEFFALGPKVVVVHGGSVYMVD